MIYLETDVHISLPYFIGVFIVENVSFSVRLFESFSLLGRNATIGQVLIKIQMYIPSIFPQRANLTILGIKQLYFFAPLNQSEANI